MSNDHEANNPLNDNQCGSVRDYLRRADAAVESGDALLGIHLYLAAFERAQADGHPDSADAVDGMALAWDLALEMGERSLAEHIYEKLEPYWSPDQASAHAEELQRLALDKLEEFGFSRDAMEDVANQAVSGAGREEPGLPVQADAVDKVKEGEQLVDFAQNLLQDMVQEAKKSGASVSVLTSKDFSSPTPASQDEQPKLDYRSLIGFDSAIAHMARLGVGRAGDEEFSNFLAMLNQRHGLHKPPSLGTLLFRSEAREDANYFMVATTGELGVPAIRMRMDSNALGQPVLVVMTSPDFKMRLNSVARSGFESPAVVILEDLDLWMLPDMEPWFDENATFAQVQMSRGAREALSLIAMALDSPEVTVFASAAEPEDMDPYFLEMLGHYQTIEIGFPSDAERFKLWTNAEQEHPSLRGLDISRLVECSAGMSRYEIYATALEAVEDAYRKSLSVQRYVSVHEEDVLRRLANYQPLDSSEYRAMEDFVVERFSRELQHLEDLLEQ